ncbi:MAG: hypothetical protein AAB858_02540, partial [Patescibacteria group bacterium]
PKRPERVHCFLASPWYASQIRTVHMRKERDFVFTKEIFDDLVAREIKRFKEAEISKLQNPKAPVVFIENKVVNIKLNGYHVDNPVGKYAREVELSLFFGIAPQRAVKSITDCLNKIIPETEIIFHSFLLPFFAVMRDLFLDTADFLLVDVGGEVTDVSLVRGHIIGGTVSFPLGKNFLLRSASSALKKNINETHSLLRLSLEGKLEDSIEREMKTALFPARAIWLRSFHESIEEVNKMLLLPDRIFLTADTDTVKWFVDTMGTEEYGQYTLSADKFKITVVGMDVLGKYLSFNDTMEHDQFLSILALFTKILKNN